MELTWKYAGALFRLNPDLSLERLMDPVTIRE